MTQFVPYDVLPSPAGDVVAHPPPAAPPPPPRDPVARAEQARRVRRKRVTGALVIAAAMAGSVLSVWVLANATVPPPNLWAFEMTGIPALRDRGFDGTGITLCIVDTGIDPTHPDLTGIPIQGWKDLVHRRSVPYDDGGHGTAMAGLIAAHGALQGVAPGVALIIAKALDAKGVGTSTGIADAIDFCVDPNADGNPSDGASIVSLSLAASTNRTAGTGAEVTASVNAALARGIVIVASGGNDGLADDGDVESPASIPGVIAVGAVDRFNVIAPFSSIGAAGGRSDPDRKPEVVAPGVDLVTTARGGGYRLVSGTSPSAALMAGAVALILQAHYGPNPSRSPALIPQLKNALMHAATKANEQAAPHDPHYGYGTVNAVATVDGPW